MFFSTTCKATTRCLSSNSSSFAASASLGRGRRQHQRHQRRARGGQKVQRNNHLVGSVVVASSSKDEDEDDYYSEEQYEWEVGGPNDVTIPHLMNIYKGEKPLKPLQTSFCAPHSKTCLPRNNKTRRYFRTDKKSNVKFFVDPGDRVMLHSLAFATSLSPDSTCELPTEADEGTSSSYDSSSSCTFTPQWVVRAGPREKVYFAPEEVHAAIVTCGGLCPGINDVIRSIVGTLEEGYGVTKISGIRYGFSGFWEEGFENMELSKKVVSKAHKQGGSILGSARGGGDVDKIVDSILKQGINMLFVIGGNGSHAGANAISAECARRGSLVSVVGVPKTIDNDILLLDKTFGFDTAVEEAQKAIQAATIEAQSALRGVGVVKLMGRQSGFISMYATLASGDVDICLIPEVDFDVHGENGVIEHVKDLLDEQGHCVLVIAEGAGQEFVKVSGTDAGGNPLLGDIGPWLCKEIKKSTKCDVKYIDPTYMVRGCVANAHDAIMCNVLGQNAVHGAFAGFTGITIGYVNTHCVYLPIPMIIEKERLVDPRGRMWHRMLTSTGQPDFKDYEEAEEDEDTEKNIPDKEIFEPVR
jgi:6-phosphofructokinase 1